MKKIILIFLLLQLNSVKVIGQIKTEPIYIDLIKEYYYPYKGLSIDTIEISKNKFMIIKLLDYNGSLKFELYKDKKITIKGKYSNSLDTFKRYVEQFKASGESKMIVENYYYPLRDSVWIFFKNNNKISKKYKEGIELNE